jgi:hypothetical protein
MASVKDIIVKPIKPSVANEFVKKHHYSGKVVPNSQLHFGCFLNGVLGGVMSFGPSMDKSKIVGLVKNTPFNDFLELNRMAFGDLLPKNAESRCISVAIRLIKKNYPNIKWIVSFADGCQCGDGTIYRASGFKLTQIKEGDHFYKLPNGESYTSLTLKLHGYSGQLTKVCSKELFDKVIGRSFGSNEKTDDLMRQIGATKLKGFSLRYIYFIDKSKEKDLTVPVLPFSKIDEMGASMYLGKAYKKNNACLVQEKNGNIPVEDGGATPTNTLH